MSDLTPERRSARLMSEFHGQGKGGLIDLPYFLFRAREMRIAEEITEAIRAENEACAKLVKDQFCTGSYQSVTHNLARLIRDRVSGA